MRIERCNHCERAFHVAEIGGAMPGTKEREDISCPHCRYTYTETSNGAFRTSPLSAAEERAFDESNPIEYRRTEKMYGIVVTAATPTDEVLAKIGRLRHACGDRIAILALGPGDVRARPDWRTIAGECRAMVKHLSVEYVTQARIDALVSQISILA